MKSLKGFVPPLANKQTFAEQAGEDVNITTLRKFYHLIDTGEFSSAYKMYSDPKKISFNTFKKWYQNVQAISPTNFEKLHAKQYRFMINYQDHNQTKQRFQVVTEAQDGKITPSLDGLMPTSTNSRSLQMSMTLTPAIPTRGNFWQIPAITIPRRMSFDSNSSTKTNKILGKSSSMISRPGKPLSSNRKPNAPNTSLNR